MFGEDTCPFCTELERTLNDRASGAGRSWAYYRLNRMDNGAQLRAALTERTKQRTVPYLFVTGDLVGGTDDLKLAEYQGSLPGVLDEPFTAADTRSPWRCARPSLACPLQPYVTIRIDSNALKCMQVCLNPSKLGWQVPSNTLTSQQCRPSMIPTSPNLVRPFAHG